MTEGRAIVEDISPAAVVTLKVAAENADAFEAIMAEMIARVKADEPGTLVYRLCRVPQEPGTYRMLEVYADEVARQAHATGAALKDGAAKFGPMLVAKPAFDRLQAIA